MSIQTEQRVYTKNFSALERQRKHWNWYLFFGIVMIILGAIAIATSSFVTLASMLVLGTLLLIGGVVQIAYTFTIQHWSGFFLSLLAGILYAVVGGLLILHPAAGALSLTLLLAAFYIVGGIFRIVGSIAARFEHWGWSVLSGVISLALGLFIWAGWPATGLWVFGLFIGIDLIFYGWFWVLLSLTARNIRNYIR